MKEAEERPTCRACEGTGWVPTDSPFAGQTFERADGTGHGTYCALCDATPGSEPTALEVMGMIRRLTALSDEDGREVEPVGVSIAQEIPDNHWLMGDEYAWFREGLAYASTQTNAIRTLSRVSPGSLYYTVWAILRGAGIEDADALYTTPPATEGLEAEELHVLIGTAENKLEEWRDRWKTTEDPVAEEQMECWATLVRKLRSLLHRGTDE